MSKRRAQRSVPGRCQKRWLIFVGLLFCIATAVNVLISHSEAFWNPKHINYFMDDLGILSKHDYVVETDRCKILNVSAWDDSVARFVAPSPPFICYQINKHWTYTNGTYLVLNISAIKESGYSLSSVDCCYKTITRVEQSLDKYDQNADAVSKVSDNCERLKKTETHLDVEFVRVKCTSKYWPLYNDIVYRNYHTLAQPYKSEKTKEKISYWSTKKESLQTPPNVLILGIDSLSRLNFQRQMPKTRQYLKDIGSVEMLGYTKVGENTFPNVVSFLSGYSEAELKKICYFTPYTAQDGCPYIWKRFSEAKYLTSHLEDAPGLNAFNRFKTGFVKLHVDYYIRPMMLDIFGPIYAKDCIGPDTGDEKVFNYIESLHNMSSLHKTPLFTFSWLTNLCHRDLNAAQSGDPIYERFLRRMDLNNTILFFISDHGFRYGPFRETFLGWYEDKLPTFWVYLPNSIRQRNPEMYKSLLINARRLLSPFDFYHSMNHILSEFANLPVPVIKEESMKQRFGQSFFKEVSSNRICSDVGISKDFCPCGVPRKLEQGNAISIHAAEASIISINGQLPKQCAPLKLVEVTAGGYLDMRNNRGHFPSDNETIVVGFMVKPGDFLFEATVEYNSLLATYNVAGNVLRMNKISTDVSCVKTSELERICYCLS